MFVDPLGQYIFDVPLGWAYDVGTSHLITVCFRRADRIEERLFVRAVPTHAPDADATAWRAAAAPARFSPELRPGTPVRCGDGIGVFAENAAARTRTKALVVRGVRVDLVIQHMGVTRPWFAGGTADLVAGAWTVVSSVADRFAGQFYRTLVTGRSVAEAMLAARTAVAAVEPDPFFWGAYLHQGANATPFADAARQGAEP